MICGPRGVVNSRAHHDSGGDRLYMAQSMLTAAEVSIQGFNHQIKVGCQRGREGRQREGRAGKDAQNCTEPPRRSARHHGLQAEISITDPLQLERRLKRARSDERPSRSTDLGDDKPNQHPLGLETSEDGIER
ncbi:hypothetical protein K503DRAFT_441160 [Rhizopogon vinicolor AM-OR11-026]|uniref:Uncharacterized protein n=1 Tax=Rhizopogon vinicolor AM-OR11-026 TaxID=1314800 RepID=A0A1B7MPG0_9AGAM|nr:hypothetical protein K503DRAFT_441160 [Rhizopogon vinicolor AM-OR11-026]